MIRSLIDPEHSKCYWMQRERLQSGRVAQGQPWPKPLWTDRHDRGLLESCAPPRPRMLLWQESQGSAWLGPHASWGPGEVGGHRRCSPSAVAEQEPSGGAAEVGPLSPASLELLRVPRSPCWCPQACSCPPQSQVTLSFVPGKNLIE